MRSYLVAVVVLPLLAACGAASGSGADAGHQTKVDAGPPDAGWTTHTIMKDTSCSCPKKTAIHLTSAASGSSTVDWHRSFDPVNIGPTDHLVFLFDFAGSASWQVTLQDAAGNDMFQTSGANLPDATNWHCVAVDYSLKDMNYSVTVDDFGGGTTPATLPTSVAGLHVKYTGGSSSSAWLDSAVLDLISGADDRVVFSESFDDPALGPNGVTSGQATIATPPSSVTAPIGFCL